MQVPNSIYGQPNLLNDKKNGMNESVKIGIIICDRYRRCAGGKCLRALRMREGAFNIYEEKFLYLVGYSTCDGCPGGNVEYAVDEMKKNDVNNIHMATGMLVGYPPCPNLDYFHDFIQIKYNIPVVLGTHPIPEKYLTMHHKLGTGKDPKWHDLIGPILATDKVRLSYD